MGQGMNPFLPSWEYVPDGEPHVFNGRVYVYGSHDRFGAHVFCEKDYVCYSAPVDNLKEWTYEGVIYGRSDDPRNPDGDMCLYAPDVMQGPDGRYYLYYTLDLLHCTSVAVSDTPAGRYTFLGYVHDADGGILGEREGDDPQFDPGCYCENGIPYLYSGCSFSDTSRGASVVRLEADMVTMASEPVFIVPGKPTAAGTAYEGHAFFEASSMRKVNDTYYFIYSSELSHELCYATGPSPMGPFTYRGTIISNIDLGIAGYKPAGKPMGYPDNNHGSIEQINGRWYVFYHRHTNASSYSRQACLEPLEILEDGTIPQVEMTTSGPNGKPLEGEGFYSAHKACVIHYTDDVHPTVPGVRKDAQLPYFTQDEPDGVICEGHIENMLDGAMAGFKYFACTDTAITSVKVRGYCVSGGLEVRTNLSEEPIGIMPVGINNEWKTYEGYVRIPDGVQALYFTFKGFGRISFAGFTLTKKPEEHQKFCKE